MWQRLGLFVSLVWVVTAYLWQSEHVMSEALADAAAAYRLCSGQSVEQNMSLCSKLSNQNLALSLSVHGDDAIIAAFGPVLLGWPIAYLFRAVTQWVLAGRAVDQRP